MLDHTSTLTVSPFLRLTLPCLQPLADRLSVSKTTRRKKPGARVSDLSERNSHFPSNPVSIEKLVLSVTPPPPERSSTKTSLPDDSAAGEVEKIYSAISQDPYVNLSLPLTHPRLLAACADLAPSATGASHDFSLLTFPPSL